MTGDVEYLMRAVVPEIVAYDAFHKMLTARVALTKNSPVRHGVNEIGH